MGLSLDEAERLGLGRFHPDHQPPAQAGRRPRARPVNDKGQNKTEAAFDARLAELVTLGAIDSYLFEPVKLRLAGKCYYRVDFLVFPYPGRICGFEVKGHLEDDAAVKLKVAAEQYPCLKFFLVRRSGPNGWDVRRVTRNGIGTVPIEQWWLKL